MADIYFAILRSAVRTMSIVEVNEGYKGQQQPGPLSHSACRYHPISIPTVNCFTLTFFIVPNCSLTAAITPQIKLPEEPLTAGPEKFSSTSSDGNNSDRQHRTEQNRTEQGSHPLPHSLLPAMAIAILSPRMQVYPLIFPPCLVDASLLSLDRHHLGRSFYSN